MRAVQVPAIADRFDKLISIQDWSQWTGEAPFGGRAQNGN
jgi:hypothetical protein